MLFFVRMLLCLYPVIITDYWQIRTSLLPIFGSNVNQLKILTPAQLKKNINKDK